MEDLKVTSRLPDSILEWPNTTTEVLTELIEKHNKLVEELEELTKTKNPQLEMKVEYIILSKLCVGLNHLTRHINRAVREYGFGDNDVPTRIALIHSEVSEAFEAFRNNKRFDQQHKRILPQENDERFKSQFEQKCKDTMEDELADCIIRLFDLCAKLDIDIEYHIVQKMRYNDTRGYKFGGKKF